MKLSLSFLLDRNLPSSFDCSRNPSPNPFQLLLDPCWDQDQNCSWYLGCRHILDLCNGTVLSVLCCSILFSFPLIYWLLRPTLMCLSVKEVWLIWSIPLSMYGHYYFFLYALLCIYWPWPSSVILSCGFWQIFLQLFTVNSLFKNLE